MKNWFLVFVSAFCVSQVASAKDYYLTWDLGKEDLNKNQSLTFNTYAAFDDHHADGVDVIVPAGVGVTAVDVDSISNPTDNVCGLSSITTKKVGDKKVKVYRLTAHYL